MLQWVTSLFTRPNEIRIEEVCQEEWDSMVAQFEAEQERETMRFICSLSNELFPGDNSAVERVETAIKNALKNMSE